MKREKQVKQARKRRTLKQILRPMFGRRFRAGSYSAFAAVLIIAIAVIANMVAGALPSNVTQLDLTSSSLYSLSDQTKRIAASLDSDVNLYLLATTGREDDTISRLLDRYAGLNDHIKISYVDPVEQPTFLEGYELDMSQLYENSVLVESGERYRLVSYADIFVTSYDMDEYYNYTTSTSFDGENALTNAIHYVTSENLPKLYTLSGHGEQELSETLLTMIEQDNLTTDSLSLLSLDEMPEDADALLINAPERDLSEDEAAMLISWLDAGGRILLFTDYIADGEMPNLQSVTAHMGLTAQDGLIMEGDPNMHLSRYPHYLLPNWEEHEITSALSEAGYYALVPIAQPLREAEGSEASVTWLLTTSDSSYAKAAGMDAETTEREDGDIDGPFHPAAVSELGEAKFCWFASAEMLDDAVNMTVAGANSNLVLNAIGWMCDQEETISIRAKSMDNTGLTVTSAQSSLWSAILIGVIPAAFLIFGISVWVRRKRR